MNRDNLASEGNGLMMRLCSQPDKNTSFTDCEPD